MRIVFDLDDTIQFANYRDYRHAVPNNDVIEKIRRAKKQGAEIIIHTARGMLSCCGDAVKADKNNRTIIEEWLKMHDVPCDELQFGKPMADIYVDDKAVTVQEFACGNVEKLHGYSGSEVWKIGDRLQKYDKESDKAALWYKKAAAISDGLFFVPSVYSYREGNIQLEYINGRLLYEKITKKSIDVLCEILRKFSLFRETDNSFDEYLGYILQKCDNEMKCLVEGYQRKELIETYFRKGTFCHGDFSTFNIIVNEKGIYLIDPCVRKWGTWLLDAAKLRATLSGLGQVLGDSEEHTVMISYFDSHFTEDEIYTIRFLELTQYIRVLPYCKTSEDRKKIKEKIELLWC